jgi:hypothetical protein
MSIVKLREDTEQEAKATDAEMEDAKLEAKATEVADEIRDFVRRDVASLRRPENDSEIVANNIGTLLRRVSGTSIQEIDRLISELQRVRDLLQNEGDRVQRTIAQFATMSQAAAQSTRIISESLTTWTNVPHAPRMRHE